MTPAIGCGLIVNVDPEAATFITLEFDDTTFSVEPVATDPVPVLPEIPIVVEIALFDTLVTRPYGSTVIDVIVVEFPYVPAANPVVCGLNVNVEPEAATFKIELLDDVTVNVPPPATEPVPLLPAVLIVVDTELFDTLVTRP